MDTNEERERLRQQYILAKEAADNANRLLKEVEQQLLASMEQDSIKTTTQQFGTKLYQLTYVKPQRVKIDEKGLRKALTAKVYDRYTTRVLNRKAMEDAMETGALDSNIVAKYVTMAQDSSPHLRMTAKDAEHE